GIIMPSDPKVGDAYRQEYYPPGKALDEARVIRLDATRKVPFGPFKHVLVTSEFSPAEPQTERKYYAAGVGEIAESVVTRHHEAFRLVSLRRVLQFLPRVRAVEDDRPMRSWVVAAMLALAVPSAASAAPSIFALSD